MHVCHIYANTYIHMHMYVIYLNFESKRNYTAYLLNNINVLQTDSILFVLIQDLS